MSKHTPMWHGCFQSWYSSRTIALCWKVVKFYDKGSANMPLDDIIDEFALLERLDHPKIARTYEIFQDSF